MWMPIQGRSILYAILLLCLLDETKLELTSITGFSNVQRAVFLPDSVDKGAPIQDPKKNVSWPSGIPEPWLSPTSKQSPYAAFQLGPIISNVLYLIQKKVFY